MDKDFSYMGLNFNSSNIDEIVDKVSRNIHNKESTTIFTLNSELIVRASKGEELKRIYNSSDIITIDSWVVYYSAKLFKKPVKEPVSAARLMFKLLEVANKKGYKIYCLGAKEEVIKKAIKNIKEKYNRISIVGYHNGYFDFIKNGEVVRDINNSEPDILFVAMSSPLKEYFIAKNRDRLNVLVSIGVGGAIDIIAGICSHAPKWVSKIGLEWFYRLIQEPRRLWKRYLFTNAEFMCLLVKEFIKIKILHKKY